MTGAIAAAVPQGSLAATAQEIVTGLGTWLILSLGVGLSVTIAALWLALAPTVADNASPVGHGAQELRRGVAACPKRG
jgi:hypothetical protein